MDTKSQKILEDSSVANNPSRSGRPSREEEKASLARYDSAALELFQADLAQAHIRGQWQNEVLRKSGNAGVWSDGSLAPKSGGQPFLWQWRLIKGFLEQSCLAVPESYTSRRSLMFNNPELARGTTNTINMGVQMIRPGEMAWAHRHSISALRFVISGDPNIFTVVDGVRCAMETGDLILTPQWRWHDHYNQTANPAIWLDVLDGPVMGAFNQVVFESYGERQQPILNYESDVAEDGRVLRFRFQDVVAALAAMPQEAVSAADGFVYEYRDPVTAQAPLPTLGCRMLRLAAGFSGENCRRSTSEIYHVVRGHGRAIIGDRVLEWGPGDCFALPNWSWRSIQNASSEEDALLFAAHDRPLIDMLGLYREARG